MKRVLRNSSQYIDYQLLGIYATFHILGKTQTSFFSFNLKQIPGICISIFKKNK